MSESKKKHLNKNHPDCAEYTKKFNKLWDAYMKLWDQEDKKYPNWQGQDSPAHEVLRPAHRKLSEDIRALQREYAYLFTEEASDGQDDP